MVCGVLHLGYKLRLCFTWGWQPVLLCGALVCLGLLVRLHSAVSAAVLVGAAVLLFLLSVVADCRGPTAAALAGRLPCSLLGAHAPRTVAEARKAVMQVQSTRVTVMSPHGETESLTRNRDVGVSVVGSGFGYWSWREAAAGRLVYTHRLSGRVKTEDAPSTMSKDNPFFFYAGTTIRDAVCIMEEDGGTRTKPFFTSRRDWLTQNAGKTSTFWSHPSISGISIGAWFMCSGHGNGADGGAPSSRGLCYAKLIQLRHPFGIDEYREDVHKNLCRISDARSHMLLVVGFKKKPGTSNSLDLAAKDKLAPNVLVQKKRSDVYLKPLKTLESLSVEQQCAAWLATKSPPNKKPVLRVLFIGSARPTHAVGLHWLEFEPVSGTWPKHRLVEQCCIETEHVDEHMCSRDCRAMQMDTFSIVCGDRCMEKDLGDTWGGVSTLKDANLFTPFYLPPLAGILVSWLGFYNFEVVCRMKPQMNEDLLLTLLWKLSAWHGKSTFRPWQSGFGRTEIRCHSGGGHFVWVDFAVRSASFEDAFKIVLKVLNPECIALHTGKYCGSSVKAAFLGARGPGTPTELSTPCECFYGVNSSRNGTDVSAQLFSGILLPERIRRV